MLNTHLRNQILKSLYQKSIPNLLETRQMLIKKTYTSGIFYLLYPSRSLVFYKVERNMLLDQTAFGGVEARILLSSSLRQVFEEPTYFRIPIGAVLWRRRGERREREAYSRGGEANRVIWQGCLLHRGRGIINFNYTTRREAAWRKGSRNKLTATASVPNLPPHQLHQPTTPHRTQQSAFPLPSTPSFQHSCIAIIHPQRHYVGID